MKEKDREGQRKKVEEIKRKQESKEKKGDRKRMKRK